MRHFLFAIVAISLFSFFSAAALTGAEYQAYIDSINAAAKKTLPSAAAIKTTIVSPAKTTTTQKPTTPVKSAIRTLSRGMSGTDVKTLQLFLISQKLLAADSATGFFGALTEGAVKKFQKMRNIVSSGTLSTTGYGAVGPKTRASIASISIGAPSGATSSVPGSTIASSAVSTPSATTTNQTQPSYPGGGGGSSYAQASYSTSPAPSATSTTPSGDAYKPETYGALHDGIHNDAPAINAAINAVANLGGGTVQLACNATYSLSNPISIPYYEKSMKVEIVPKSGVSIKGCGPSSILRVANNVNQPPIKHPAQLFGTMVTPIYATGLLSNVTFSNFTIDMNGINNSCGGGCFTWSAVLGADKANNVTVDNVSFLNNPGSNDIQFGLPDSPELSTNITIKDNRFSNGGYAVNPAAFDYSALWLSAINSAVSNNTFDHGSPPGNPFGSGAAIELHGNNILASGNTISNYWSGVNIANLSGASDGLKFNGNTLNNVSQGVIVWVQTAGSRQDHVEVINNSITLNASNPISGVNLVAAAPYPGGTITINNNTITTPAQNNGTFDRCGINVGRFSSVTVMGNTISNSPGPSICGNAILANAAIYINSNTITNPGMNATGQYRSGIWMPSSPNIPGWLAIKNNSINGNTGYGIWGALNTATGEISGNTTTGGAVPVQWTGSGTNLAAGAGVADTQRKEDLQTLANALQAYYAKHNTYRVQGGAGGAGIGIVATDGSPTIIQALYNDGDLASNARLPVNTDEYYLLYLCDAQQTFALSAKLDTPTAADVAKLQASCNGAGANSTYSVYGRNYAVTGSNGTF